MKCIFSTSACGVFQPSWLVVGGAQFDLVWPCGPQHGDPGWTFKIPTQQCVKRHPLDTLQPKTTLKYHRRQVQPHTMTDFIHLFGFYSKINDSVFRPTHCSHRDGVCIKASDSFVRRFSPNNALPRCDKVDTLGQIHPGIHFNGGFLVFLKTPTTGTYHDLIKKKQKHQRHNKHLAPSQASSMATRVSAMLVSRLHGGQLKDDDDRPSPKRLVSATGGTAARRNRERRPSIVTSPVNNKSLRIIVHSRCHPFNLHTTERQRYSEELKRKNKTKTGKQPEKQRHRVWRHHTSLT